MIEDKEKLKKEIEKFKIKVYHELEHNTSEVLIFGNDNISTMCGDINLIIFKIASMFMQLSKQSGISEKELIKGMQKMIKMYKIHEKLGGK